MFCFWGPVVWSYRHSTVQSALGGWIDKERESQEKVFLWMCFFVNNQHRLLGTESTITGSDNLEEVFEDNLRRIGSVIAILDTWQSPEYLTRIWCIFEQFTSIKLGIKVR